MYTEGDRDELLERLIARARTDPAIVSAALVGSAARRSLDRWSDIDLALGLAEDTDVVETADRWTRVLAEVADVADALDLWSGPVLYRVFLLDSSLQVDLSFWRSGTLASSGGQAFVQLFGEAVAPTPVEPPDSHGVAAWGWLYALHSRSAIARNRNWQAVQMLDGLRGQLIALCCSRHGLETHHGRGVDQLPGPVLTALADTVPAAVTSTALAAAHDAAVGLLSAEVAHVDLALAARLQAPLAILRATASPTAP